MKMLGIRGKKGVGKDFVASVLREMLKRRNLPVVCVAFADPLKSMLVEYFGLERESLYGDINDKENTITQYQWERIPAAIRSDEFVGRKGPMSVRDMMKFVGTDIMRCLFDQDIWIKYFFNLVSRTRTSENVILVTDLRFPNEVEAVRSLGGRVMLVTGPQRAKQNIPKDIHSTESALDNYEEDDYVVANEWGEDITSLEDKLKGVEEWLSTTSTDRKT